MALVRKGLNRAIYIYIYTSEGNGRRRRVIDRRRTGEVRRSHACHRVYHVRVAATPRIISTQSTCAKRGNNRNDRIGKGGLCPEAESSVSLPIN